MKLDFTNKDGEKVLEVDSSKEKDTTVLHESLKDLAKEEDVTDETRKADGDEQVEN